MSALVQVTDALRRDRFLTAHAAHYCREMRIKAYTQFLDSYKSVTVASMARAFGISVPMLDECVRRLGAGAGGGVADAGAGSCRGSLRRTG
jgi:26S proteasome regulatory subunit N7